MALVAAIYTYNGDTATMDELRPAHREFLASHQALLLSGPLGDAEGAVIVFDDEPAALESWLDHDPFWKSGVIAARTVKEWKPGMGSWRAALGI